MRYGRHSVENYDLEHPNDDRVVEAREEVAKLNQQDWQQEPGEEPIDYRHRVEQGYNSAEDKVSNPARDADERQGARDLWITDRADELSRRRAAENHAQSDEQLKVGGQVAARAEIESFEQNAREGKNPALNAAINDLTEKQAARQEHISNDIVGPALDEKIKELGLEDVKEPERRPEPQPEPAQPESPANAQLIPEDVMEKAAEAKADPEVSDDRLARLREARERIETPPPPPDEHSRTNELER